MGDLENMIEDGTERNIAWHTNGASPNFCEHLQTNTQQYEIDQVDFYSTNKTQTRGYARWHSWVGRRGCQFKIGEASELWRPLAAKPEEGSV